MAFITGRMLQKLSEKREGCLLLHFLLFAVFAWGGFVAMSMFGRGDRSLRAKLTNTSNLTLSP